MAFKLDVITDYGIMCNYWKISKIEKDYFSETAYIVIYGYPSKDIRDQGKICLEKKYISIRPVDFQKIFGIDQLGIENMNDLKSIYEFLKLNFDEFKDSEIC